MTLSLGADYSPERASVAAKGHEGLDFGNAVVPGTVFCAMEFVEILGILLKVVGGLGLFLLGMKNMSEGMQAVAGARLRALINAITNNRLVACAVGALVTCTIQSSSVTTVMIVGFVNAGLMTLVQAVGVILGADIGTTITGWILVLHVAKAGLPMLGIAALFYLFAKNEKLRFGAMFVMGLGMVFFGLDLMKGGFAPLRETQEFLAWFSKFSPDGTWGVIKCVLVGAAVTAIVQSSSATVGITMGLASTGVIDFTTAVALVLGQNIGTTVTAYLASLGTSLNARRVAYAHILIKTIAVVIAVCAFHWYMRLVRVFLYVDPDLAVLVNGVETFPNIMRAIAVAHTLFNVVLIALFLPFVNPFVRFLVWLTPARAVREAPKLTYLDVRMLDTPALGIEQSHKEMLNMARNVEKMLGWLRDIVAEGTPEDSEKQRKIFRREEIMDNIQHEIVVFVSSLLTGSIPRDVMERARAQLRMADEYETLSDYVVNLLKMHRKLAKHDVSLSPQGKEDLLALHDQVAAYILMINDAVEESRPDILTRAQAEGTYIDKLMKEYRAAHTSRVAEEQSHPLSSLVFPDMLSAYRRMKDHALNVAEAFAGEK